MTIKYLVNFTREHIIFLAEMNSFKSLDLPRKILWRQNHENSFIGQGIYFATLWLVHSMNFYWECSTLFTNTVCDSWIKDTDKYNICPNRDRFWLCISCVTGPDMGTKPKIMKPKRSRSFAGFPTISQNQIPWFCPWFSMTLTSFFQWLISTRLMKHTIVLWMLSPCTSL